MGGPRLQIAVPWARGFRLCFQFLSGVTTVIVALELRVLGLRFLGLRLLVFRGFRVFEGFWVCIDFGLAGCGCLAGALGLSSQKNIYIYIYIYVCIHMFIYLFIYLYLYRGLRV